MIESLITLALLALMAAAAMGVVKLHNLFAVVILSGTYSFLLATLLVVFDAVDVAMTEAAVGAGMSTVLMLSVLGLTKMEEAPRIHSPVLPLAVAGITGAALIYATLDLPEFGIAEAPIHQHVAPYYLERSIEETTVPNVVTAVLASYRGYDTLGEVTVIFTAGIGVLLLLKGRRRRRRGEGAA